MHPWLSSNSEQIAASALTRSRSIALARFASEFGDSYGVRLVQVRRTPDNNVAEFLILEIDVDRPQKRKYVINGMEPVAVACYGENDNVSVFSLRPDFPHTPHQNSVHGNEPASLCVDDRPWHEAQLSWTPNAYFARIREWLRKAAKGELHDPAQVPEPLFFRPPLKIILPPSVLNESELSKATRLVGVSLGEGMDPNLVMTFPQDKPFRGELKGRLVLLPITLPDQLMSGMRRLPGTLGELTELLSASGIDILPVLRNQILDWSGWKSGEYDRLSGFLTICLATKVADGGTRSITDLTLLIVENKTVGELGAELGVLLPGAKSKDRFVKRLPPDPAMKGAGLPLVPADVLIDFDRALAVEVSGAPMPTEPTKVFQIGAGAIGSHFALTLARQGANRWSIMDDDTLLPHNLARHALGRPYIGGLKARALAHQICELLNEPDAAVGFTDNFLKRPEKWTKGALEALSSAEVIVDASASIAVSRAVSDHPAKARRLSVFFNPAGNAVVLLTEDVEHRVTLRDLEAQYYRTVLVSPNLTDHLNPAGEGVRYSGSCRTLSSRIPESSVAILSAIAARAAPIDRIGAAGISVWSLRRNGEVQLTEALVHPVRQTKILNWTVTIDAGLEAALQEERKRHLPAETGGVLLGIVDSSSSRIHVVHHLPAPPDSKETAAEFERGVEGLSKAIKHCADQVLHQVRYVGEWHSHPDGVKARPSKTDMSQLAWLAQSLAADGCPGLMLIVGAEGVTVTSAELVSATA